MLSNSFLACAATQALFIVMPTGSTLAAVLVVAMISAALSQIFRVALYQYAATGQAVGGFDQHLLQGAFTDRRRWR